MATAEYGHPSLSLDMDTRRGRPIVVVWTDTRHAEGQNVEDYGGAIYAQLLTDQAEPIGGNIRVSDLESGVGNRGASVSMNASGAFVIAWHNTDNDGVARVWARRYGINGQPEGSPFRIDDDPSGSGKVGVDVLLRDDGGLIVGWTDRREGPVYAYAQFFDLEGLRIGSNFRVARPDILGGVEIAGFDDGRFLLNVEGRVFNSVEEQYLHFFEADFSRTGSVVRLDQASTVYPLLGRTALLTWRSEDNTDLFAGVVDIDTGVALSDPVHIDDAPSWHLISPTGVHAAWDSDRNELSIAWIDHRNDPPGVFGSGDVYVQRLQISEDWQLSLVGANLHANYEEKGYDFVHVLLRGGEMFLFWMESWSCFEPEPGAVMPHASSIVRTRLSFLDSQMAPLYAVPIVLGECLQFDMPTLSLSIYPNPTKERSTLVVALPLSGGTVAVDLFDATGRIVSRLLKQDFISGAPQIRVEIDTGDLASGVYFIKAFAGKHTATEPLIIVR